MLAKYDGVMPDDFFAAVSHLWLTNKDGKVEIHEKTDGLIHADVWGQAAFENPQRGYFSEKYGIVTAHTKVKPVIINQLARKFKTAIYIRAF